MAINTPSKQHWPIILGLVALALVVMWVWLGHASAPAWPFTSTKSSEQTTKTVGFNKKLYSTDDAASPWFVVNKQRTVPATYVPSNLRQPNVAVRSSGSSEMLLREDAAIAVEKLVGGAKQAGINLMLVSGYRSYGLQQSVYRGNVSRQGQAEADKTSARPGHSEHQTGLAADLGTTSRLCELDTCFGQTPEGKWLAAHAYEYGFIIRYPDNMQSVVGYTYEPWHIRYVGPELAREIHETGQVMEQFFELPSAPDYL